MSVPSTSTKGGKGMSKTTRNLSVILANSRDRNGRVRTVEQLRKDVQSRPWSALKRSQPNDVALLYVGGPEGMKIWGVAVVAEKAFRGVPDAEWTESNKGYFAQHAEVRRLRCPVSLQQIRRKFPGWKLWNRLDGHRVCNVPVELRKAAAKLVASKPEHSAGFSALGLTTDEVRAHTVGNSTGKFPLILALWEFLSRRFRFWYRKQRR
jgi:hypothetical protein